MAPPPGPPRSPWPLATAIAIRTRPARAADAGPLLALMRGLAAFEGYADRFAVTERDLVDRGLGREVDHGLGTAADRQFTAIVAEAPGGELVGYAVILEIPFTYDLRPSLIMKELYVAGPWRATGVGSAIMDAVLGHARAAGCGRVKWDVLPDNLAAKAFYRRFGGRPDVAWEPWILELSAPPAR